jgi:hypothetical protein
MKDFDTKWRACAAQARSAARWDESAPFGFAQRVAARALDAAALPVEFAWDRHMLRWLAGSVAVLVLCALLEVPHWRDARPLEPGIENAVAQLVWSL